MKNQFYFKTKDSEICYNKEHIKDVMRLEEVTEMEVIKAVPDKTLDIFWCRYESEVGEKGEGVCGKQCYAYSPRNGKSGCCRYYSTTLYTHGEKMKLTLD